MTLSRRDLIVGVGAGVPAVAAVPSLAHAAVRRVGIAQPGQPDTFATGRLVASYGCLFRNIQTVIAPDHAVTEIIGELSQRTARRFVVRGRHRQLGRKGLVARLDASGPAIRTEPT